MKFEENELVSAALIGFDMIEGPYLKWKKEYTNEHLNINLDTFSTSFYLAFRGGNTGKKPKAILYDDFYIVAFPRGPKGLELCCLFMKPHGIEKNIRELNKIADKIITKMDSEETDDSIDNEESDEFEDISEIKRLINVLLKETDMATPELRRYFKLSNSQIWKIMNDLESSNKIKRSGKVGRSVYWTV
jgi:hypothetical protein